MGGLINIVCYLPFSVRVFDINIFPVNNLFRICRKKILFNELRAHFRYSCILIGSSLPHVAEGRRPARVSCMVQAAVAGNKHFVPVCRVLN